jgi:hypothetical protein
MPEPDWKSALERRAFRALNAIVLPSIQRGFGAPCVAPWGLVVLEHTGRRSGQKYESPLLALRLGSRIVVSTFRNESSQWLRNLERTPDAHLWLNGERLPFRAQVLRATGFGLSVLEPA